MSTLPSPDFDVLLCYRGRYREQVVALAHRLRDANLRVTYDVEILASPEARGLEHTEVVWFGDGAAAVGKDRDWRAPVQDAIQRAELNVFLYDGRSPSLNVWNEVAWVSRSGREVFLVIDTGRAACSLEHEGILLGTLQSVFAMARQTLDWEIPQFGYHFIAQDDPRALETQLDVLANRVLDYLRQVRAHGLPTLRLDNDLTMATLQDQPLERARRRLRSIQRRVAELGLPAPQVAAIEGEGERGFRDVLDHLHARETGAVPVHGRLRLPGSPFTYPEESERRRFRRSEDLAQRARPGPFESAAYFPTLAVQAASLEMLVEEAMGSIDPKARYSPCILSGTLQVSSSRSIPVLSTDRQSALVLLNRPFMDLCYQVIKLCIGAWETVAPAPGGVVGFRADVQGVRQRLAADPERVATFVQWLHSYCSLGYLAGESLLPSDEQQLPLQIQLTMAERFSLAHGYAALGQLDFLREGPPSESRSALLCDELATDAVLTTAIKYDLVDPTIAVQGCLMVIHVDEMVRRCLALFPNDGSFVLPEVAPPLDPRIEAARRAHRKLARTQEMTAAAAGNAFEAAKEAAATAFTLWDLAQPALKLRIQAADRICSMWVEPKRGDATTAGTSASTVSP